MTVPACQTAIFLVGTSQIGQGHLSRQEGRKVYNAVQTKPAAGSPQQKLETFESSSNCKNGSGMQIMPSHESEEEKRKNISPPCQRKISLHLNIHVDSAHHRQKTSTGTLDPSTLMRALYSALSLFQLRLIRHVYSRVPYMTSQDEKRNNLGTR
jgi:hypothetical protein